jgi:hypothetical protein
MGLLDQILAADAVNVFCDPNGFGEPITYTQFVNGVAQAPVSINAVIDRDSPVVDIPEGTGRVKQIRLSIPNNPIGGISPVNIGDMLTAPWRVGDAPSKFRVTEREHQDTGMWEVTAEVSKN